MSTLDLSEDSKRRPTEIVSGAALSEEAVALMADARNTLQFIHTLSDQGLFGDALMTVAKILPRQFAIIWACRCVEEHAGGPPGDDEQQCLALVKQWLGAPDDQLRRACMDAAEKCDYDGPWGWLAGAVAFSGGSLAPPDLEEVPPAAHLTAAAVGASMLSIVAQNMDEADAVSRKLIDSALTMVAIPGGS